MAFVIKFFKGIRNHWKKSTFAAIALAYGVNYTKEYYETQQLMRDYCIEAKKYGDQPISVSENLKTITIILNPSANKRKATKQFEKYCAPILHLAGMCVDIVQTDSEGHARTLMQDLKDTNAVIVAGGDGTLCEVITGIMRRPDHQFVINNCPIGVLPLGKTSSFARTLFPGGETLKNVRSLADAAMAIVKEHTKGVDVMKIEIIQDSETEEKSKPVYAVGSLEWGAYRDAQAKRDKYWYFGSLRKYVTYIFNGYKNSLTWNCAAEISYTLPCEGCNNCRTQDVSQRWWQRFIPQRNLPVTTDYSKIVNENCSQVHKKEIRTSDLLLSANLGNEQSKLDLNVGPPSVSYIDFVTEGWKSEKGLSRNMTQTISLKQIDILPKDVESNKEMWFSIDREDFEVKPVKITLLPKAVKVFCLEKVT